MLREVVVPQLHTKPSFHELFFQQDMASPHYALTENILTKTFHSVSLQKEVALNGQVLRMLQCWWRTS